MAGLRARLGTGIIAGILAVGPPAGAQEFLVRMQAEGRDVLYGPILSVEMAARGEAGAFFTDMMAGPPMEAALTIEAHCHFKVPPVELRARCEAFARAAFDQYLSAAPDEAAARRLRAALQFEPAPRRIPQADGDRGADIEGLGFVFRVSGPIRPAGSADGTGDPSSDVIAVKPVARGPAPWTEASAAPLDPVERVWLAPDLAPPVLTLVEDRPPPRGFAMDLWLVADWEGTAEAPPTILALDTAEGPLFSIHVSPDYSGIEISGGTNATYRIAAPLTQGRPHRISLRTRPGETEVFVDGKRAGSLALGVAAEAPVRRLTLGALGEGGWPFEGQIGGLRLWGSALDHVFVERVVEETGPNRPIPHEVRLIAAVDPSAPHFTLAEAPGWRVPAAGWWRQSGQHETRIHNYEDFVKGAAPNLSPLHVAVDAYAGDEAAYGPSAAEALAQLTGKTVLDDEAGGGVHTQFSVHPLYRIRVDDGIDPAPYELTDADGEWVRPDSQPFPVGRVTGLLMLEGEDALSAVGFIACDRPEGLERENWYPYRPLFARSITQTPAQEPFRIQCERAPEERRGDYVWFDEDEDIRGLSWRILETGIIGALEIHTNRDRYGPFANGAARRGKINRFTPTKRIWMDEGVGFYGLMGVSDETGEAFRDLAFMAPPWLDEPGVTIIAENGDALRFRQERGNFFRGWSANFPTRQSVAPFRNPTIQIPEPGVMLVTGVDGTEDWAFGTKAVELERIEDRAFIAPNDSYNNTFVALSKAVNLQANYTGYDLMQMDPVHLTRTGATGLLFRQPDGKSKDYYDFNRIFVPRGLTFVPEFTGDLHKETHETSSYQEFKRAVSNSVSVGLSSKALPSFSMSSTMRDAAETISERKMSRSIGFSRAYFYDLVLRKDEIELHPDFVTAARRLAARGDYQSFIETFGTHYPVAVVYGGAAVLTVDTNERTRGALLQKGVETKTQVGLLLDAETSTSLDIGSEKSDETTQQFRELVGSANENFYWIGGAHVGLGAESWSVGTDGVAPVHVALRPIDELFSSVFFDDPEVSVRVRNELKRAIEAYFGDHVRLEPQGAANNRPGFVEIRMDHLYCGAPPESRALASWGILDLTDSPIRTIYPPRPLRPEEWRLLLDLSPTQKALLRSALGLKEPAVASARAALIAELPAALGPLFEEIDKNAPVATLVYPNVSIAAYDHLNRHLANFADPPQPLKDEAGELVKAEPIRVLCNTFDDILPKSPFLQNNAFLRVAMDHESLVNGAKFEIYDRRDGEYKVLHHHVSEGLTRKERGIDAFLDGITLGGKILWDEYVTGEGSALIDQLGRSKNPDQLPTGLGREYVVQGELCDRETIQDCPPRSKADFQKISGKWFPRVAILTPPDENCAGCQTYQLHYSIRYIE